MTHGIFISYSDFDREKVDIIISELKESKYFHPIVIAENRDALKPLAQKVTDGIIQAKIVIPILTKKSVPTQWINQEIGFATALVKKIMPIVENDLIDNLKGFIHKQVDLPYNYSPSVDKLFENDNFTFQVRKLISDLENEFNTLTESENLPEKTDFEKSLEETDKANKEFEFQSHRISFLKSTDAIVSSKKEILNMHSEILEKIKKFQERKITFSFEQNEYEYYFILKSIGFSFSIFWMQQHVNSNQGAELHIRYWEGIVTKEPNVFYFPGEEPKMLSLNKFIFDLNREDQICWLNLNDGKQYSSTQLVDSALKWLIQQVLKRKLENNNMD